MYLHSNQKLNTHFCIRLTKRNTCTRRHTQNSSLLFSALSFLIWCCPWLRLQAYGGLLMNSVAEWITSSQVHRPGLLYQDLDKSYMSQCYGLIGQRGETGSHHSSLLHTALSLPQLTTFRERWCSTVHVYHVWLLQCRLKIDFMQCVCTVCGLNSDSSSCDSWSLNVTQ